MIASLEYDRVGQCEVDEEGPSRGLFVKFFRRILQSLAHISRRVWYTGGICLFVVALFVATGTARRRGEASPNDEVLCPTADPSSVHTSTNPPVPIPNDDGDRPSEPPDATTPKTCAEQGYGCIGDRLGNNETLEVGRALCSHHGRYMFGMNERGSLLWRDCFADDNKRYYRGKKGFYFIMKADASWVVYDGDDRVQWEKECKEDVHWTEQCLTKPTYDCPYLHLHSDGVLVLNWIDDRSGWLSKNVKKLYDF